MKHHYPFDHDHNRKMLTAPLNEHITPPAQSPSLLSFSLAKSIIEHMFFLVKLLDYGSGDVNGRGPEPQVTDQTPAGGAGGGGEAGGRPRHCPQAFAEGWMKLLANGSARKPNCLSETQ